MKQRSLIEDFEKPRKQTRSCKGMAGRISRGFLGIVAPLQSGRNGSLTQNSGLSHIVFCEMRIYPDIGLASVIMANKTSFNSRKILSELDKSFVEN